MTRAGRGNDGNDGSASCCSVVELRQYTLVDGRRDSLVGLFDEHFVESQERCGIHVIGQFRDLERPNMFVWLRGFRDMNSRETGLAEFYYGRVWRTYRDTANATMLDSDNVLLLQPAWPGSGLPHPPPPRPTRDAAGSDPRVHQILIQQFDRPPTPELVTTHVGAIGDQLHAAGLVPLAWYLTEPAVNTFPALPIRSGEHVLVSIAAPSGVTGPDSADRLASESVNTQLQAIRAAPTARSQLR